MFSDIQETHDSCVEAEAEALAENEKKWEDMDTSHMIL
jgi:hypothetical protein